MRKHGERADAQRLSTRADALESRDSAQGTGARSILNGIPAAANTWAHVWCTRGGAGEAGTGRSRSTPYAKGAKRHLEPPAWSVLATPLLARRAGAG